MNLTDLNGTYVLDPTHTTFSFVTRHAMVTKVRGSFEQFEGQAVIDGANPANTNLEVTIDAASVNTRNADRDGHIRSADFFDVENHPKITFKSTSVEKVGENQYKVTGDLTIRGVTRPVTLDTTFEGRGKDPWGGERIALTAKGAINRKDFGLTWNAALETGGVLVSDEVKLEINVEAVLQA